MFVYSTRRPFLTMSMTSVALSMMEMETISACEYPWASPSASPKAYVGAPLAMSMPSVLEPAEEYVDEKTLHIIMIAKSTGNPFLYIRVT